MTGARRTTERRSTTDERSTTGRWDVLVVGAGPGGLAAAKGARAAGAERVLLLERDSRPGGILNQCIHDGFGIIRYRKQLTGPEYAIRAEAEIADSGIELLTGCHVLRIGEASHPHDTSDSSGTSSPDFDPPPGPHVVTAVSADGLLRIEAGAVVLATGCRERTRGAIAIPGSRPAGVFTAGVAQNLVNIRNIMPGRKVVILGSGDVGMIMARRLSLEGATVVAVVEVLPEPAGLSRNVSQCLYDYGIPIFCGHTVSRIIGEGRLTAVEIARVDPSLKPVEGTERLIDCDTLVLSVGLIPENEVAQTTGVALDPATNGMLTDSCLQTNVPGIFACGNARRIMDLADLVSEQGELAGRNAAAYLRGERMTAWDEARTSSMAKGFPEDGVITCTLCPAGCQVRYDKASGTYKGNRCARGADFAEQERTAPQRILTTTVKVAAGPDRVPVSGGPGSAPTSGGPSDHRLLPVRSEQPIPKQHLPRLIRQLYEITVKPPVNCGDVILKIPVGGQTVTILSSGSLE